jgi:hypothetical protein
VAASAAWGGYYALAAPISGWLDDRFGQKLTTLGRGRILAPRDFIENRAYDAVYLLTVLLALFLLVKVISSLIARRVRKLWLWAPVSLVWFVAVNVFVAVAGNTGLSWMIIHSGHQNLRQSGFHIERFLLR